METLLCLALAFQPICSTAWNIRKVNMSDERKRQIDNFLEAIAGVESSGGVNFNHPTIKTGIHKGQRAAGTYGLMPNTVKEVVNRMRLEGNVSQSRSCSFFFIT